MVIHKRFKLALLSNIALLLFFLTYLGNAQQPSLQINSRGEELRLFGPTNTYYQIQYSEDLADWRPAWGPWGQKFFLTNSPANENFGRLNVPSLFYRAEAFLVSATNGSSADVCAEDDNLNIALVGDIPHYSIIATHPTYQVMGSDCTPDFNNCTNAGGGNDYAFTPLWAKLFDNGTDYLIVNRKDKFWRPQGMDVTLNGGSLYTNIHYIELGRKIPNAPSWPIFFALYCDGNLRLIPFPPSNLGSVCFGSSVIVGPAEPAARPMAEIAALDYRSASRTMLVTYRAGGTAILDVGTLTRANAVVKVAVNYPTDLPFCTVRSMFVSDGNSDCDHVQWKNLDGLTATDPILSFSGTVGTEWFFTRLASSAHNNSSPDIRLVLY